MNYEVLDLESKIVVGLIARTNNSDPDMGLVIGGLWSRFYQQEIYFSIKRKKNDKTLGIYTDFESDETKDYSIITACEVEEAFDIPAGTVTRTIPAGRYAKFVVKGDMHKAVSDFWQKLWSMELPRSYLYDYEEYQNSDMDNAEIHIYIGLKD